MNRQRVIDLASRIEQEAAKPSLDIGFSMVAYLSRVTETDRVEGDDDQSGHDCGTTACIAGWAVLQMRESESLSPPPPDDDRIDFLAAARDWLELTTVQSVMLFCEGPSHVPFHSVTPAMAVRTLRHLAETGRVDWSAAL